MATALGGDLHLSIAGAETTVAIGLTRLGHRARWVGLTGEDEFGRLILRTLRAEGIDTTFAATTDQGPTGLIVFEPRITGLIRTTYYRNGSAGSHLDPTHVTDALTEGARVVHLTGITAALGPGPRAAVTAAAAAARRTGTTVCLDVNHRLTLWTAEEAAQWLRPLAPTVDILVASDDELAIAAPATAATETERVSALLNSGVKEVVIKRGAAGAEVFTAHGSTVRPAIQVPVRDTVGAGDAFVAGCLSGLLDGEPIDARLDRAVATAGDWEGLPTLAELSLLSTSPGTVMR